MWNKEIELSDDSLRVKDILEILQCALSHGELEEFSDELVHGMRFDEGEYFHEE